MKSFFRLSGIFGFVLCLGLSSCGRLSPGLSTDYGKVIEASDGQEAQPTSTPYRLIQAKVHR